MNEPINIYRHRKPRHLQPGEPYWLNPVEPPTFYEEEPMPNAKTPRYTIGVDESFPVDPIYVAIIVDENGTPKIHGWSPSPEAFENGPAHTKVVCVNRALRIREIPMNENGVSLEPFVADPHAVASVACAACENEWVAVVPDGTDLGALECPKCGKQHTTPASIDPIVALSNADYDGPDDPSIEDGRA